MLQKLLPKVNEAKHTEWLESFVADEKLEREKVIKSEVYPAEGELKMGEVVNKVSQAAGANAVLVTDVGQNQMMSSRYFQYTAPKSIISSGGLGTMGFGLPAAIGAKIGAPERPVCFFVGDGGIQMTVEELGVILQYGVAVKIIILNNNFLGMVRQWQDLFYSKRYSQTPMVNPNFVALAQAYGIQAEDVESREELDEAIKRMMEYDGAYVLNVKVEQEGYVFPMVPAGSTMVNTVIAPGEKYQSTK